MRKLAVSKRLVEASVLAAVIALVLALPLFAGTHTYPLTVVEGNSMDPTLVNGDLVYYTSGEISNGSIVVFTQGTSTDPMFGAVFDQTVIHRVIGLVAKDDGSMYIRTQGDNNKSPDGELVPLDQVLGTEALVVPRVGLLFLFLRSPQGLIAVVGLIVVGYLSVYENKALMEKRKKVFLGQLAQKTLAGQIPRELYTQFELAVQNIEHVDPSQIETREVNALTTWFKSSLEGDWKISSSVCACGGTTLVFEGSYLVLLIGCNSSPESGKVLVYAKEKKNPLKKCIYCLGAE